VVLPLVLLLLAAATVGLVERREPAASAPRSVPTLPPEAACTETIKPGPDLPKLVRRLRPGDVACMAPGVYGARGVRADVALSGQPGKTITLRAQRRGTVFLRGMIILEGRHLVLDGVVLDGPTGSITPANAPDGEEVLLWAKGNDLLIRRTEARNGLWRAGIFVSGTNVTLDACWVHDIGPWNNPGQDQVGGRADNIDHGVYWGGGTSGRLTNSLLEHNLAYGLQISGGAENVLVAHNTIVRNGAGGIIWAERTGGSSLVGNIIAENDGHAVNTHMLVGALNAAKDNWAWRNSQGNWNDTGPVATGRNQVADPRFVGGGNYRLQAGSPAIDAAYPETATQTDYDGRRRPQGDGPDPGAFERPSPASP
jgi:hypothetical protein